MRPRWCAGSWILAAALLAAAAPARAQEDPGAQGAPAETRSESGAPSSEPGSQTRAEERESAEPPAPEETFSPTERIPAGGDVSFPVDI